jgi:hypothetical protein
VPGDFELVEAGTLAVFCFLPWATCGAPTPT